MNPKLFLLFIDNVFCSGGHEPCGIITGAHMISTTFPSSPLLLFNATLHTYIDIAYTCTYRYIGYQSC